jgi:hypothetical protein
MNIKIRPTLHEDIPAIFEIYDDAIAYQKTAGNNHWLGFDPAMVAGEIAEGRHFKIRGGESIVATFCITLSDPLIWKDSAEIAAIYIHRIAIRQDFRGNNVLGHAWVHGYIFTRCIFYQLTPLTRDAIL